MIYLRDHVTGDGLAAALLLCAALEGRTLAEAAAVMTTYPQAKENVAVRTRSLPAELAAAVERVNAEIDGTGPRPRSALRHGARRTGARRGGGRGRGAAPL